MTGSTLLEVVVTITILAVLLGLATIGLRSAVPAAGSPVAEELATVRRAAIESGVSRTWSRGATTVRYFPDGSASGGWVTVDGVPRRVDVLTGRLDAEQ
jgi:type II secretory pathway pseudopilin PulG